MSTTDVPIWAPIVGAFLRESSGIANGNEEQSTAR